MESSLLFSRFLLLLTAVFMSIMDVGKGDPEKGLYPSVINVASNARITTNATCGLNSQEIYCKLTEGGREPQCGVCDSRSPDTSRRHPIENAIDGTSSWWQSPTLENGREYEWVTITLDLQQVYQIAYIIIKSAISPRPGNWVLERSVDGVSFQPWQYFAQSDQECQNTYGIVATKGRPKFASDDQVICTSYFSRVTPLEGGEIHVSLVNGRPGASGPSDVLLKFTEARYVRLRFQKILTLRSHLHEVSYEDPQADPSLFRSHFYSIKDISIGGRCVCNGHADSCEVTNGEQKCSCEHNTCGDHCEMCCPLFGQYPWKAGDFNNAGTCVTCECYGHATECHYDEEVHRKRLSIDTKGRYDGGGICLNCTHDTDGINCHKCKRGFYKPKDVPASSPRPCYPCQCIGPGTTGECVQKEGESGLSPAGACICNDGFEGARCEKCAKGYHNYPSCEQCPCDQAGSLTDECEGECVCKENVIGERCDVCKPGTFHKDGKNPKGCTSCFCNEVIDSCEAAKLPVYTVIQRLNWQVTDLMMSRIVSTVIDQTDVKVLHEEMSQFNVYYFLAPEDYLGSRTTSYGQSLSVRVSWVRLRGDTSGRPIKCPDVIIEDLIDIEENQKSSSYMMGKVTRRQIMEILNSMKTLLIRARFHSEQVEATLHEVVLEYGKEGGTSVLVTGAVERCHCSPGYVGLSCEFCEVGYRRVNNTLYGGLCLPCQCHGHVEFCDPFTGSCGECLHNTVGVNCEKCLAGYYGDATQGTPNDCQPCACPLPLGTNHFTPRCVQESSSGGHYRCQCPQGYDGLRCERCVDGYFGNPMVSGNFCQPCDCSGNVDARVAGNCDRLTGRCLKCLGNIAGWKCEKCKEDHYGDPKRGRCLHCGCNEIGSISSQCDVSSGQCQCKPLYTGRQCERCIPGHGGVSEGCPPCQCNLEGSLDSICDPFNGQCPCKPGVGGRRCDACLENHFGQIRKGCSRCDCNELGSYDSSCNVLSGQCSCRSNVVSRTCDRCRDDHWGHSSGKGCRKCDCDSVGSLTSQCEDSRGHCICRQGVGGHRCDACLPGFWGFSPQGCKRCDPCDRPGRFCDPNSGRCICPRNTEGDRCERCSPGSWNYDSATGCQPCNCSGPGSLESQCDARTGRCVCARGFEAELCNRCTFGNYGYPRCFPCNCEVSGTHPPSCNSKGICQCDENGQCPCKSSAEGRDCGKCVSGTFGLSADNPDGCMKCYCFRRSQQCIQADLTWSQLALPGDRTATLRDGEVELNVTNQLRIIPGTYGDVTIATYLQFLEPLYWQLPVEFMKEKIMSYNGYLRFKVQSEGATKPFPEKILRTYPLVSLQGNYKLILEHYPVQHMHPPDGSYEVRLKDVVLDVAAEGTPISSRKALGVEKCICPHSYRGTSCQDPNIGFYRWFKDNYRDSVIIIDLIGESRRCECNGRSESCDQETGKCQLCRDNTHGRHCEICAPGFYGDPSQGPCRPCACPSLVQNFAQTCYAHRDVGYVCQCREGYTGNKCDRCTFGFYGDPVVPGGLCKPCNCDPNGSVNQGCGPQGRCSCKPGITGIDCSQCAPRHVVSETGCESCVDGCVDDLLDDVEEMIRSVTSVDLTGVVLAPWPVLHMGERIVGKSLKNVDPAKLLKMDANSLIALLVQLRSKLESSVHYLENYAIGTTPTVAVSTALDAAQKVLNEIMRRNFSPYDEDAQIELKKSKKLLDRMKEMHSDMALMFMVSERMDDLIGNLQDLRSFIKDSSSKIAKNLNDYLMDLRNDSSYLSNFAHRLFRLNEDYRREYVQRAHDHAMDLQAEAIKLESLFKETKDVADGPLRAAQVYQRIADALKSSEAAARSSQSVAENAYKVAYPGDPQNSVVRRAGKSHRTSQHLKSKAEGIKRRMNELSFDLEGHRSALGEARRTLKGTKLQINNLQQIIKKELSRSHTDQITAAIRSINDIHAQTSNTLREVEAWNSNLTNVEALTKELSSFDRAALKEIKDNINNLESTTAKGIREVSYLQKKYESLKMKDFSLKDRIEALKRKIQLTRQHASSIRVSLTNNEEGKCMRKYQPGFHPSTTNNLFISYAINDDAKNALILYVGTNNASDFMAVEMVNRRIHFMWSVGGGTQRIHHPLKLLPNTPQVSKDTKWYHITATRVGNVGQIRVQPANVRDSQYEDEMLQPVVGSSQPGFSKLDLHATDSAWVGGAPGEAFNILKTKRFYGCLHHVAIDGETLGLWNFTESAGCSSCNEGVLFVQKQEDEVAFGFNGKGFFKGDSPISKLRRPSKYYSVVLHFTTLDENALLFLAVNGITDQYFSISLEDGYVQFVVQFDRYTQLKMRSSLPYNNVGSMTHIEATVLLTPRVDGERMGKLVVGTDSQLAAVRGGADLDLLSVPFYFGGVDPEFNHKRWGRELTLRSLLGCMSGLSVVGDGKNPFVDGQFYGVDRACSEKPLHDVGFLGQGFLELPSHALSRTSSFGFSFQTMEPDALLMLSTFKGQPLKPGEEHPPDFYSVSLVEGFLDIRLQSKAGESRVLSRKRYNDGNLHSVFVVKEHRRLKLLVDDIEVESTQLPRRSHYVLGPSEGGLYFGGVIPGLDIIPMVGSSKPLKGCIRDVIVNNRVLSFLYPTNYKNVYIGRCSDLPPVTTQTMEGDIKEIESCQPPPQHTLERGGLKFGDQLESHVITSISRDAFKKDFRIYFQFRTYYPNGVFFMAFVLIEKDMKYLKVLIDGRLMERTKIPRALNVGSKLFIGGVPNTLIRNSGIEKIEPLRGCMRNISINGEEYNIPSISRQDIVVGVGQCFFRVQPGTLFPGDAYTIYSNDFQLSPLLELQLEFRTSQLNGILMTTRDVYRKRSFVLEIINGAVVVKVDPGENHSFSAKFRPTNRYSFCDSMWHTVKAQYIEGSLTLKVDKYDEAYGFNGTHVSSVPITKAPLYIGGIPDSAPQGILSVHENFRGCIRNVVINNERRDWIDMYLHHNTLLNACPV